MADPKITVPELIAAATLTGSELVPLWQASGMVRATLAQLVTFSGGIIDVMVKDLSGLLLASGTANALTVTPMRGSWDLVDGAVIAFRVATLNTGAATLNVNGKGARSLTKGGGVALQAGDLFPGQIHEVVYLATPNEFRLRAGSVSAPMVTLLTSGSGVFNTTGARRLRIRGVGGGGGSGGVIATGASEATSSSGGGSGAWFEHEINGPASSYNWTVGAGGAAGTAGGANPTNVGGDGGDTTFGPCIAGGGKGGAASAAASSAVAWPIAAGGVASGANILNAKGNPSSQPLSGGNTQGQGIGGGTPYGAAANDRPVALSTSYTGSASPANSGAGASGSFNNPSQAARGGAQGGSGLIIVEAFY